MMSTFLSRGGVSVVVLLDHFVMFEIIGAVSTASVWLKSYFGDHFQCKAGSTFSELRKLCMVSLRVQSWDPCYFH